MLNLYSGMAGTIPVLASLGIMLLSGFLITRITKLLHMPNVSGYILAGVIIGPQVLGLVPQTLLDGMSFVSDIALALIAFGVGRFFKLKLFRGGGIRRMLRITLLESLLAGLLILLAMRFCFGFDWSFSLLLAAVATATAPASTMMTIRQYHAKGSFVNTLLQVIALDNMICLLLFSVASTVVRAQTDGSLHLLDVLLPILYNLAMPLVGIVCGWLLSKLLTPARSKDNRLILTLSVLLAIAAVCALLDISPLLSCMLFSAAYINLTRDKRLYKQLNRFTPPIMSLFFIISGMKLNIGALGTIGLVGVVYVLVRLVGKYAGAWLGCRLTKAEPKTRRYLGLALIPSAGVAIGLAFLGERVLPPATGSLLVTVVLASSVLYEMVGPVCARLALFRSGAIRPSLPPLPDNVLTNAPSETQDVIADDTSETQNVIAESPSETQNVIADDTSETQNVIAEKPEDPSETPG